ncbi:uncharacterized protein LOC129238657 [Anastrepha obliqua]|uniref:uncharacterized protein LOC129238657 n=1 Tax=Anastrepha obliqua TaxID=95512 RepID=UPI002409D257|nr:uncharacterized protein LOC129238657 [Anastrepha obliqua]
MFAAQVLFSIAFIVACCCNAQELNVGSLASPELQARDRRSFDVGLLLRNLLLNSATASDLKANVTRNVVAAKRPPATTRRPRPTTTTAPPPPPPTPPPPPPPQLNPFLNKLALFASSSNFWKLPPLTTTTTTTTTTAAPMTEPPPRPRPRPRPRPKPYPYPSYWSRPPFGNEYDYLYPSAIDGSGERVGSTAVPSEYDFEDVPAPQPAAPPPSRKAARNRQRPASPPPSPAPTQPAKPPPPPPSPGRRRPAPPAPTPPPPQPQRDRVLYQYAQRDDISFNDNNDDASESPESAPEADNPQQDDDNTNGGQDGADAANGGEEGGDAANGGDNEIPSIDEGVLPPEVLSPRLPSSDHRPYTKSLSVPSSYYDSFPPSGHRFSSFDAGSGTGGSGFGSSSFGFSHASPAKGIHQFRDTFSDFHTTYDGHFQPSIYSSFKY